MNRVALEGITVDSQWKTRNETDQSTEEKRFLRLWSAERIFRHHILNLRTNGFLRFLSSLVGLRDKHHWSIIVNLIRFVCFSMSMCWNGEENGDLQRVCENSDLVLSVKTIEPVFFSLLAEEILPSELTRCTSMEEKRRQQKSQFTNYAFDLKFSKISSIETRRALIDTEDLLWSKEQQVKRQVWHLWAEVSSQGWHLSDTQRGKISFNVLFSR